MRSLRSMIASDDVATRHLGATDTIACATRSGRKVHAAHAGSSVTHCGVWLRVGASAYRVRLAQVETWEYALCEKCFRDATPRTPENCPYCAPDELCALHTHGGK